MKKRLVKHPKQAKTVHQTCPWLVLCILLFTAICFSFSWSEPFEESSLLEFATQAGINTTNFKFSSSRSTLAATRNIAQGEIIFTVPRRFCITPQSIRQSEVGRALQSVKNEHFVSIAQYAVFIAVERRNKLSIFHKWFASIPSFTRNNGGVLYWSLKDVDCVDERLKSEIEQSIAVLNATVRIASTVADALELTMFDIEELRWALTAYFQYNVRDQAVIPLLSFARYSNEKEGVSLDVDPITGALVVKAGASLRAGDEITQTYPRGAASLLTARGTFDIHGRGIDAGIDIQSSLHDSLGKRLCAERYDELIFEAKGFPTTALLSCFSWLVMTENERARFAESKENLEVRQRVFSGLLKILEEMNNQGTACTVDFPLTETFEQYNSFASIVRKRNIQFLEEQLSHF